MSRYTYIKLAREDVSNYGLDIAIVLAFTRFRREVKPEWVPSRRVIMTEFGLTQGRADKAVKAVCQMLSLRHKRTPKKTEIKPPKKAKAFPKTAPTGETTNHICGEITNQSCGETANHIPDTMWLDSSPPNKPINELSKEPINKGVRYPQWSSKFIMCSSLHKYLDNGEWFWMLTKKDNEIFLWDYYNLPPTDSDHELYQVFKSECDYEFHNNMIVTIGDLTPQHFIDAHYNPAPFIGAAR